MSGADPVRLIEAAYANEPNEREWLSRLVHDVGPYDQGAGVVACTIDLGRRARVRRVVATHEDDPAVAAIAHFLGELSPEMSRHVLAPTEFVGNAAWRVARLCKAKSVTLRSSPPPMWGLVAGDGAKNALLMAFLGSKRSFTASSRFPHRDRRVLGLVGAHWSAALRLRAALGDSSIDGADAVLSTRGKVLDAKKSCASTTTRASLSEAVLRSERARGKLRRADGEEATSLWRALVEGKWSIVEVVERDGQRLLLAKANAPMGSDRIALTKEESDVVWLLSFGHSYKYVAYELGLSLSAVVRRLESAMKKLGVRTRADLLRKLAR